VDAHQLGRIEYRCGFAFNPMLAQNRVAILKGTEQSRVKLDQFLMQVVEALLTNFDLALGFSDIHGLFRVDHL
jgi:hypothetical protein